MAGVKLRVHYMVLQHTAERLARALPCGGKRSASFHPAERHGTQDKHASLISRGEVRDGGREQAPVGGAAGCVVSHNESENDARKPNSALTHPVAAEAELPRPRAASAQDLLVEQV